MALLGFSAKEHFVDSQAVRLSVYVCYGDRISSPTEWLRASVIGKTPLQYKKLKTKNT